LEPFVGMAVEPDKWEFIREVSRVFLKNHAGLFESRIKAGRIRDGHGDLKAEHIYFHQGLKIIDCIEFNDRFRYGDAILDLAFLHMELERYGHPEWSDTLIAAYVDRADDPQAYNLLDLYAAYRAVVGLKVACLRIKEGGAAPALTDEARSCLNLAYRYAIQFSRPSLWVFCGLPASGKSSLARRAAEALFMPCLQSDRLRKQSSSPIREVVDFGQGSYSLGKRAHLYAMMLGQAHDILKKGRSVALDATFSSIKWRDEARQLASDLDTNIIFAECRCREKTTTARLKARENRPGLSDARLRNFNQIKDNYEPMTELPPETHLLIDTDLTPRESFLNVLAGGHRLKREQVAERLKRI